MVSFYVGIDVSKGYADFVIQDAQRRLVEPPFQLDDTFEGHCRLYELLESLRAAHPGAQLFAAAESTGGYESNWIHSLRRFQATLPLKVARLNPALVNQHAKAEGCRVTTDAVSAEHIAGFLVAHASKVVFEEEDAFAGLRAVYAFTEQLSKQRTAFISQFEKLLYRAHPELVTYASGSLPQWLLKLVSRYPTARRLARARAKTLTQIPFVTPERARELIASARESVASVEDKAMETLLRTLAQQLLQLDALINEQKKSLSEQLELPEEIALLKSFGSIGDYTAVGLLLEIKSVQRFASAKKIASFFGVHPSYKKSGDGVSSVRMSKQGPSRMRAMLFMITLNAVQNHPTIAPLYEQLLARGMSRMSAIGVCMHKVLRILYGILKHCKPYDPEIDRNNRERIPLARSSANEERKRRYHSYDSGAPLSARAKKRRQQKHSQGAHHTTCGMSTSTAASVTKRGNDPKSLFKEHATPA